MAILLYIIIALVVYIAIGCMAIIIVNDACKMPQEPDGLDFIPIMLWPLFLVIALTIYFRRFILAVATELLNQWGKKL